MLRIALPRQPGIAREDADSPDACDDRHIALRQVTPQSSKNRQYHRKSARRSITGGSHHRVITQPFDTVILSHSHKQ